METTTPMADIPAYYFNRERIWLKLNRHVLDEAHDKHHPLLEQVKFLSIFASNLDEFFMIRVSGLQRQRENEVLMVPPDGMTPANNWTQSVKRSYLKYRPSPTAGIMNLSSTSWKKVSISIGMMNWTIRRNPCWKDTILTKFFLS